MMKNYYLNIFIYVLITLIFVSILCLVSWFLSYKKNKDISKLITYETGCLTNSDTRVPLNIHFFVVGVLFLILDIEVVILFPWIVSFNSIGLIGYYKMFFLMVILGVGFLYEWYNNVLNWHIKQN